MMRTRFAPSPNGYLHMGHGLAAIIAHDLARAAKGEFMLRIEDVDITRSRPAFVQAIFDDLCWLGLEWHHDVVFQSTRSQYYHDALAALRDQGLIYRCFCSRSDIKKALARAIHPDGPPVNGRPVPDRPVPDRPVPGPPVIGPDGPIYPGTCRHLSAAMVQQACQVKAFVWRLDMAAALEQVNLEASHPPICAPNPLSWHDLDAGTQIATPAIFGDAVLSGKDGTAKYHLAATLDDARDEMTHIVRGRDLFAATHLHRLLQALLGLPTPQYLHHDLLLGSDGRKLSKSEGAASLRALRQAGGDGHRLAQDIRNNHFPVGISRQAS